MVGHAVHAAGMPYCVVPEFVSAQTADAFTAWARQRAQDFQPSRVYVGGAGSAEVVPWRRSSQVLRELGELGHELTGRLRTAAPEWAEKCGIPQFAPGRVELELTSSGDGDFFRVHRDDATFGSRVLSYVCFFHSEPRAFSGGELHLYLGDQRREIVIAPTRGLLVAFRSSLQHEVRSVYLSSRALADSRLTLNGWLHARG